MFKGNKFSRPFILHVFGIVLIVALTQIGYIFDYPHGLHFAA
jgi:hypothetical protein